MQPNATNGSFGFAQSLVRSAARRTWQQTTALQTLHRATQSNPAATLTRTLQATGKCGTACFDAGRYRPLLSGTGDSPLGACLYKTLVFWDVTPVPKIQADGQGAAEFLAGIHQFGAFQADGRTAVAFKAHLGGAFQCCGAADVDFLAPLPGVPQGLLSGSGAPPLSNRKGRNYNEPFVPGDRTCSGGAYTFQIPGPLAVPENVAIPMKVQDAASIRCIYAYLQQGTSDGLVRIRVAPTRNT